MYNLPENIDALLLADELESLELSYESIGAHRFESNLHTRLCIDLVDCEPSIY